MMVIQLYTFCHDCPSTYIILDTIFKGLYLFELETKGEIEMEVLDATVCIEDLVIKATVL